MSPATSSISAMPNLMVRLSCSFVTPLGTIASVSLQLLLMTDLIGILVFAVAYFVVMRWVLPRLGVPT
jgi:hypothetical protein